MSELKAYRGDIYVPVYGSIADAKVYLKSAADKVIARHKYKRCLAMADYCKEATYYFEERLDKCSTYWRVSVKKAFYERWHKHWLELAEKFKEAK